MLDRVSTCDTQDQQRLLSTDQRERPEHLPVPNRRTINLLWLIIVSAFVVIMTGSSLALTASIFIHLPTDYGCQIILTIFTTATSFLAGLFITSPVQSIAKKE